MAGGAWLGGMHPWRGAWPGGVHTHGGHVCPWGFHAQGVCMPGGCIAEGRACH